MAAFLSPRERAEWLASLEHRSPVLLRFARWVDDLLETALEQTGQELPAEHAVVMLLRDAAEETPRDETAASLAA